VPAIKCPSSATNITFGPGAACVIACSSLKCHSLNWRSVSQLGEPTPDLDHLALHFRHRGAGTPITNGDDTAICTNGAASMPGSLRFGARILGVAAGRTSGIGGAGGRWCTQADRSHRFGQVAPPVQQVSGRVRHRTRRLNVHSRAEKVPYSPQALLPSSNPAYIERAGLPAMAINGRRNKPFGPGGSTRRLHQFQGSEVSSH
jgi:hypothetical protein